MKNEIDRSELKRLKTLAKKSKKTSDELIKEFDEVRSTVANDRLAVNVLFNKYRKTVARQTYKSKQKAEVVTGFVWGDTGLIDKALSMRESAKRFIKKNGKQAAIDAQLINGEGKFLDQRNKLYGRENPNYLEPMPDNLKIRKRTVFGIFKRNGKPFKYGSIHTEDNRLAGGWAKIKRFVPCSTFALIKEDTSELRMNSSAAKDTTTVFKKIDEPWEIAKIIEATVGNRYTPIKQVEEHYEAYKDAWDRKIFVKGMIGWLNLDRVDMFGRHSGLICDPDNPESGVRLEIPSHVRIEWGEGSEVVVLGKTRRTKYRDEEGELQPGDVVITVWGIFPIPGMSTPVESSPDVKSDEDINGWLD